MAAVQSSTEILGRRLLKDIAADEGSLEDVSLHFLVIRLLSITTFPLTCLKSFPYQRN
jgi:hypothetical protein